MLRNTNVTAMTIFHPPQLLCDRTHQLGAYATMILVANIVVYFPRAFPSWGAPREAGPRGRKASRGV